MTALTYEDVQKMIQALVYLHDETGELMNANKNEFLTDSQIAKEIDEFSSAESVKTVLAQGSVLIEVAADHLIALKRVLSEPVQTIAPWTSARSILESSAISAWLFDPRITIKERIQRSLAFRFEGLRQQSKFSNSIGEVSNKKIDTRIANVEQEAQNLGYDPVRNKLGKRIGIGQQMPSTTDLIGSVLNEESSYRLLSALAHAHPWALQQVSFKVSQNEKGSFAEKDLDVISVAFLCKLGALSFVRPVWYKTLLFGWNTAQMREVFQSGFADMPLAPEERFWGCS